jgi:hypothetical protein
MPPRKRTESTPDGPGTPPPAAQAAMDAAADRAEPTRHDQGPLRRALSISQVLADRNPLWNLLMEPFPQSDLERLPKPVKRNDDNRGRCDEQHAYYSADGYYCGGWHARSVHLTYVGHAGITMRLNNVLGPGGWTFEPYALDNRGLPGMDGLFYGRLTITLPGEEPVTKWDVAADFKGPQEAYGDCLRRCAMRFGIGTYLWSKSDTAIAMGEATDERQPGTEGQSQVQHGPAPQAGPTDDAVREAQRIYDAVHDTTVQTEVAALWQECHAKGLQDVPIRHPDDPDKPEALASAIRRYGDALFAPGNPA